jgi:hypothetical protein
LGHAGPKGNLPLRHADRDSGCQQLPAVTSRELAPSVPPEHSRSGFQTSHGRIVQRGRLPAPYWRVIASGTQWKPMSPVRRCYIAGRDRAAPRGTHWRRWIAAGDIRVARSTLPQGGARP